MTTDKPMGPITVQWVFVVGVDSGGHLHMIDHEYVTDVHAKRIATLDDINAAAFLGSREKTFTFFRPSIHAYSVAFLVFQMPDGYIAASPNIFENLVPLSGPSNAQVLGAFGVLQNQIISQRLADLAAQVAGQTTLSMLRASAEAVDPDASKKTKGGLYVA